MKKFLHIFSTVILVILIAVVVMVFIARASGKTPSIFGFSIFRVSSDSMEPTLKVDDIIMTQSVKPEEIKYGDIVTYDCLEGDLKGQTITHRVAKEPVERDGVYYFTTKGDKSGAQFDAEISYDQVEGKYLYTIPFADKLYTFFLSPAGLIAFISLIVLLFGYEMVSLIISYKSIDEHDDDYYEPKPKKESKKRKKTKKRYK